MLAGRPPFSGSGPGQVIAMHLYQQPQPISRFAPKVPAEVAELLHRLLTKEKEQRPAMAQVADDIGRLLAKLTGGPVPVRSRPPAMSDPQATRNLLQAVPAAVADTTLGRSSGQSAARRRIRYLGAGLAGLALLSLTVVLLRRSEPPSTRVSATGSPAAVSAPTQAPAPPRKVVWKIQTTPPGAAVLDEAGTALGVTPWISEQLPSEGVLRLRVRKDGYQEARVTIERSEDVVQQLSLTRQVKPSKKDKKKSGP